MLKHWYINIHNISENKTVDKCSAMNYFLVIIANTAVQLFWYLRKMIVIFFVLTKKNTSVYVCFQNQNMGIVSLIIIICF